MPTDPTLINDLRLRVLAQIAAKERGEPVAEISALDMHQIVEQIRANRRSAVRADKPAKAKTTTRLSGQAAADVLDQSIE